MAPRPECEIKDRHAHELHFIGVSDIDGCVGPLPLCGHSSPGLRLLGWGWSGVSPVPTAPAAGLALAVHFRSTAMFSPGSYHSTWNVLEEPSGHRQAVASGATVYLLQHFLGHISGVLHAVVADTLGWGMGRWEAQALVYGIHCALADIIGHAGCRQLFSHLLQIPVGLGCAQNPPVVSTAVCGGGGRGHGHRTLMAAAL